MNTINIVCLKWGDKYNADYVNRLYSMVKRNTTIPFEFYCITEDSTGINENVKIKPLPNLGLKGWWFKLTLFQKDAYGLKGRVLFIDLDMVIVDNIDSICQYKGSFSTIKGWNQNYLQNAIFVFNINEHSHIYYDFIENHEALSKKFNGDDIWMTKVLDRSKVSFFPDNWVVSYKYHCNAKGVKLFGKVGKFLGLWFAFGEAVPPKDTKIVAFHGKPDPEDVIDKPYFFWKKAPFVRQHWC